MLHSSNRPSYKRYSFQLKPGTEQASLIVDDAEFEICRDLSKARSYLSANIDWLLATFGQKHGLVREDIIMVGSVYPRRLGNKLNLAVRSLASCEPQITPCPCPTSPRVRPSASTYNPSWRSGSNGAHGLSSVKQLSVRLQNLSKRLETKVVALFQVMNPGKEYRM